MNSGNAESQQTGKTIIIIIMDAAMAVNSLALLGFNTDDYTHSYKGLAFGIEPVTVRSFDRENEVTTELTLLCILHFLLTRLDFAQFPRSTRYCWPYHDSKAKNTFKRAVNASLERIYADVRDDLPSSLWLLHMYASASDVWSLLRSLTDMCLECAIASLTHADDPKPAESSASSERRDTRTATVCHKADLYPNAARSGSNATSEDEDKKIQDELIEAIKYSQTCINSIIATKFANKSRQKQYMQELSVRLNKAKRILNNHAPIVVGVVHANDSRRMIATNNAADARAAVKLRYEKIAKLRRYVQLLKDLSESSLLQESIAQVVRSPADNSDLPAAVPADRELGLQQAAEQLRDTLDRLHAHLAVHPPLAATEASE